MNSTTSQQHSNITLGDVGGRLERFHRTALVQVALSSLLVLPALLLAQPAPEPVRTDYNMQAIARPSQLSAAELTGRRQYAKYCALCHDPISQPTPAVYGPALNSELLKSLGNEPARKLIMEGTPRMPGFQYLLKTSDVDNILAFLRTYSARPTARAVDGRTDPQPPQPIAGAGGTLDGGVKAVTGEPLEGVAVSARAAGRTVTVTVFTDAAGRYVFPALAPGRYAVWAQAEGYRAANGAVAVATATNARLDLRIEKFSSVEDVYPQLSSGEWLDSLPSGTAEERRMKEIFRLNCEECHAVSVALQRRFDEKGWAAIIAFMQQQDYDGWYPPDPAKPGFPTTVALNEENHHYAAELATYLAKVRGPNSPRLEPKLVPRPTGEAARVVITGYDIPPARTPNELSWYDGSVWSDGAATGAHGAVGVHDVLITMKGDAWVTQAATMDIRQIMKVDAASGQVSAFNFPATDRSSVLSVRTHGLGLDSKGNVWFGVDQRMAKIGPAADTFEQFVPPAQLIDRMGNMGTVADGKGKLWTEGVPGIMTFDPDNGRFSLYDNAHYSPPFFYTYGVTGDVEGNGWWTVSHLNLVETVNVQTGKTTEILMRPPWIADEQAIATPADRAFQVTVGGVTWGTYKPGFQFPRRIGADKNGTAIWVPNYFGRNLARIDIESKQVTYYKLPVDVHPYFVDVDKNHVVWIGSESDDRLLSFDPGLQQWTVYRLPINGCESRNINVDQRTGDVWVACYRASKIFRFQFRNTIAARS
jgi:streptogramin lyase/mono/diheme cytochrome c family protein